MNNLQLPYKHHLTLAYTTSLVIAAAMGIASAAGILYQTALYPASQRAADVGTDALNLIVGLPMLLGSMWLTRRGSLIGLLCWPGALLYVLYIYTVYVVGIPLNALFLLYVALVVLSAYTLIGLVASINGDVVQQRLNGLVPVRLVGGVLAALAILFGVRNVGVIITALTSGTTVAPLELATLISDLVVQCPALIVGGILLWRREALGYVAGAGLLLQIGVLFVGVPIGLVLGAVLTGAPVDASSAVLLPVAVPLFVLLIPFVRAAAANRSPSPA